MPARKKGKATKTKTGTKVSRKTVTKAPFRGTKSAPPPVIYYPVPRPPPDSPATEAALRKLAVLAIQPDISTTEDGAEEPKRIFAADLADYRADWIPEDVFTLKNVADPKEGITKEQEEEAGPIMGVAEMMECLREWEEGD